MKGIFKFCGSNLPYSMFFYENQFTLKKKSSFHSWNLSHTFKLVLINEFQFSHPHIDILCMYNVIAWKIDVNAKKKKHLQQWLGFVFPCSITHCFQVCLFIQNDIYESAIVWKSGNVLCAVQCITNYTCTHIGYACRVQISN